MDDASVAGRHPAEQNIVIFENHQSRQGSELRDLLKTPPTPRHSMGLPYMPTLGWCQGGLAGAAVRPGSPKQVVSGTAMPELASLRESLAWSFRRPFRKVHPPVSATGPIGTITVTPRVTGGTLRGVSGDPSDQFLGFWGCSTHQSWCPKWIEFSIHRGHDIYLGITINRIVGTGPG